MRMSLLKAIPFCGGDYNHLKPDQSNQGKFTLIQNFGVFKTNETDSCSFLHKSML